jgi:hypothetical protein
VPAIGFHLKFHCLIALMRFEFVAAMLQSAQSEFKQNFVPLQINSKEHSSAHF